jgi:hypothetical protein
MKHLSIRTIATQLLCLVVAGMFIATAYARTDDEHTTTIFQGKAVNGGTVTHVRENGKSMLRLSEDFQIPNSPDPHWQLVDSKGIVYRLQALKVKEGLSNREIEVPKFVPNVAKVQIWCAFAEVLLGEASFSSPVK